MVDIPAKGLFRTEDHQYYWNGFGPVPGITTIIKEKANTAALMGYAAKHAALYVLDNLPAITALVSAGGRDDAYKQITGKHEEYRDAAADLGSRVHYYFERHGLGEDTPDIREDEASRIAHYTAWVAKYKPHFIESEFYVFHPEYRYGGTADVLMELWCTQHKRWCLWLIDYKTGNGIYGTTALQLSGIQNAAFMVRQSAPTEWLPIPIADHYGVFHVTGDSAKLFEYLVGNEEWEAFQACLTLKNWGTNREHKVKLSQRLATFGEPPNA